MKIIIPLILFLLLISCSEDEFQDISYVDNDSLASEIQKKIAEKKELEKGRYQA